MMLRSFGLAVATCSIAGVASASAPALIDFSGGGPFDSLLFESSTVGWGFEVNSAIVVTDLGFWIDANGVNAPHQVGLWDSNQNLLAAVTIEPGAFNEVDGFAYVSIDETPLSPGQEYVLGWTDGVNDGDSFISQATSATFAPEINWLNSRGSFDGGFTFPDTATTDFGFGRFGPNMLFIPSPGTAAFLAFSGGVCGCRRRR
jgi:hypothetical protein